MGSVVPVGAILVVAGVVSAGCGDARDARTTAGDSSVSAARAPATAGSTGSGATAAAPPDSGPRPPMTPGDSMIRVDRPRPGDTLTSPFVVSGAARGNWFFEASFPVRLIDADGTVLAVTPAHAQGDWMTTRSVPFEARLRFTPRTSEGRLVLEKDNPSGLPAHADSVIIPVRFHPPAGP